MNFQELTTEELTGAVERGRRALLALEMANLSDMRLDDGSMAAERSLDRNFDQIQRVKQALANARAELKRREQPA